jgi:uncharacterized protein YbjT (DUF2867 family)
MNNQHPILITGAAGEIGGVSRTIVEMLLDAGHPVRAFVRQDDERAEALRTIGAEVFVGDLLNIADVNAALAGCRRIYFSMSLSPYYTDAAGVMAAAARAQGIEVLVSISEFEQSFMTFETMTASEKDRRAALGGLVAEWSPQQRAHWITEQILDWSGLPVVHIRAAMFVENPILTWLALGPLASGELHLPFGTHELAPLAAFDVAEVCAKILLDPKTHVSKTYELTGPQLKDIDALAADYAAVLGRPVSPFPHEVENWNAVYIDDSPVSNFPHIADHLKTLTRLIGGGGYRGTSDQLENLLGRAPKTVRWALARHPRIQAIVDADAR